MYTSVCLSVQSRTRVKNRMSKLHKILYTCSLEPWLGHPLTTKLCTSGFVDDVVFSHNGLLGMWHLTREHRAGNNSRKFPTYSLGGTTMFDFVVM